MICTPKQKKKLGLLFEERKQIFLDAFAKEAPEIRASIADDLPSYNALLSLKALTFEEFALQGIALERKIPYDKDNPPTPACPTCGTEKRVGRKGTGQYQCRSCGQKFTAHHKSIAHGSKEEPLVWMKLFYCLLDGCGVSETCKRCKIAPNTYYHIRNRLFYAMQLMMDEVKLYGVIQVDNAFVRVSYKGSDLCESPYDEDSVFFDPTFRPPRGKRVRGGPNTMAERNINSICIFSAIDDRGHVLTRYAGVGAATCDKLQHYIPSEKFLLKVAGWDPFSKLLKEQTKNKLSQTGENSLIVADKEKAIQTYAKSLNIDFEAHVFRRAGVQVQLPPGAHNIQRVNALHKRLKEFLSKHHDVSSKYLPGYLIFFEFIENTGASQRAIEHLFQIIARPGVVEHTSILDNLYTIPNYLEDFLHGSNPLGKQRYEKLLGFYLYDHIKHPDDHPDSIPLTMEWIENEVGFTAPTIRKHYRELFNAGYRSEILDYFNKSIHLPKPKAAKQPTVAEDPLTLVLFEEYNKMRSLPRHEQISFDEFMAKAKEKYGQEFKRTTLLMRFSKIREERGIAKPLPQHVTLPKKLPRKAFLAREDYLRLIKHYREKGMEIPKRDLLYAEVGKKYGINTETARSHITHAGTFLRRQKEAEEKKR